MSGPSCKALARASRLVASEKNRIGRPSAPRLGSSRGRGVYLQLGIIVDFDLLLASRRRVGDVELRVREGRRVRDGIARRQDSERARKPRAMIRIAPETRAQRDARLAPRAGNTSRVVMERCSPSWCAKKPLARRRSRTGVCASKRRSTGGWTGSCWTGKRDFRGQRGK